jgi:RNA polymerase sigma-70 factor (ECF subfamily)
MPSAEVGLRDDAEVVAALRAGDERAFTALIDQYSPALLAIAQRYVSSRAVAEEVLQDTWMGLLRGIDDFEERSSLKTWLFRILINVAMSRSRHERRSVPFSSIAPRDDEPSVDPDRFMGDHERWAGHWSAPPRSWDSVPEDRLLAHETLDAVGRAIGTLPERQQQVIVLRDVVGWSSDEVRDALQLSTGNQRVLLHRARSKVRATIESELGAPNL